jgi:hypothetical protein
MVGIVWFFSLPNILSVVIHARTKMMIILEEDIEPVGVKR